MTIIQNEKKLGKTIIPDDTNLKRQYIIWTDKNSERHVIIKSFCHQDVGHSSTLRGRP